MSTFYKFDIVARTGGSIKKTEARTSINDLGHIAFVGDFNTNEPGNVVFVGGDSFLREVTNSEGNLQFGTAVQINNSGQVIANWRKTNGVGATYLYNSNNTNDFKVIATAGADTDVLPQYDFDYYSLLPIVSVNNNGESVFAAFEADLKIDPLLGFSYAPEDVKLVTANNPVPILGSFFDEKTIFTPLIERPLIADNGNVIITEKAGMGTSSPRSLILYDNDLNVIQTIASASTGFTQVGASPGISDDGQIVTFYGDLAEAGAISLGLTPGPGIFASIKNNSGYKIIRIADLSDGFSSFETDVRVGVNSTHRSEPFTDSNNNGVFDVGETFTDQDNDGVFDVSQRAVTIVYMAKDTGGNLGIYSSRLNFFGSPESFTDVDGDGSYTSEEPFADQLGGTSGSYDWDLFDPNDPTRFSANKPTLVAEVGQTIPGFGQVSNLNIYDPINNRDRGDISFWASTGTSEAVFRSRPQQVIYLDFNPVSNFKLGLDLGADSLFQALGLPLQWKGNVATVFSELAPNRNDLVPSPIQTIIAQLTQQAFDSIGANVQVVTGPTPPTDGQFTHVYVGDGPNGSANPSGLEGIATSIDLFNQDIFTGHGSLAGKVIQLTKNDTALVFVDNIFRPDPSGSNFVDATGNPVFINTAGSNQLTSQQVATAIANTVIHEVGHTLGLLHLDNSLSDSVMAAYSAETVDTNGNGILDKNRNLMLMSFSSTSKPLEVRPGLLQNDQGRLAYTVGSDSNLNIVSRLAPEAAITNWLGRGSAARLNPSLPNFNVAKAVLGIVPQGEEHSLPVFLDLGSGNLSSLLNLEFFTGLADSAFFLASTNGNGVDIFGVPSSSQFDFATLDLTEGLALITDERIRAPLFDPTGLQGNLSFDIIQKTSIGFIPIGQLKSANLQIPENTSPVAVNDNAATSEDLAVNISVLNNDSDAENNPLILNLVTIPNNGIAIVSKNGSPDDPSDDFITYTPNANFNGSDLFTYQVNDGANLATATVTIEVTPVDDAPFALNPIANIATAEDTPSTSIDLSTVFSDVDNDIVGITKSLVANTNPTLVNATIVNSILTLNYQLDQFGAADITIRGNSNGQTVNTTFTVTLTSVNDAPTVTVPIANQTTTEGQFFTLTFSANTFNDVDTNDTLTYTATLANGSSLPGWLTFDTTSRTFGGTPTNADIGTLSLKAIATDTQGATTEDSFNLQINAIAPIEGETAIAPQSINFKGGRRGLSRKGTNRSETMRGTRNNDTFKGGGGNDRILGQSGNDRLKGDAGNDRLKGAAGNDQLDGGTGNDQLDGGTGNDLLKGSQGNDTLLGGTGNDVLLGGVGRDILSGGAGRDLFSFNSLTEGSDRITDFDGTIDLIDLRSIFASSLFSGTSSFARFNQYVELVQISSDTEVRVDIDGAGANTTFGTLVTLQNFSASQISSQNFVIA